MATKPIKSFKNKHYFLSNFFPCFVEFEGLTYPSAECAYQAAKTTNQSIRMYFTGMPNGMSARRWGNQIELREDWGTARYEIMAAILRSKFSQPYLKEMLLNTKDAPLEESEFGELLMQIREELAHD